MKVEALGLLLCTTLLSGFAITAQADVHIGIAIGGSSLARRSLGT